MQPIDVIGVGVMSFMGGAIAGTAAALRRRVSEQACHDRRTGCQAAFTIALDDIKQRLARIEAKLDRLNGGGG